MHSNSMCCKEATYLGLKINNFVTLTQLLVSPDGYIIYVHQTLLSPEKFWVLKQLSVSPVGYMYIATVVVIIRKFLLPDTALGFL